MSKNMAQDVERFGWHIVKVMADDLPAFAYSVGFFKTFQHPEMILFGLPLDVMHTLLNLAGEELKEGKSYNQGVPSSDFLDNYECTFGIVLPEHYDEHFGQAIDFYGQADFPALQLFWPDRDGHFPWDEDSPPTLKDAQPDLRFPFQIGPQP